MIRTQQKLFIILSILLLVIVSTVSAQAGSTYTVQPGDSLSSIADRYNISVERLAAANGILYIGTVQVGQVLVVPDASGFLPMPTSYTVRFGDSLQAIANRYETTVEALVAANNITATTTLTPGQVIQLPAQGGSAGQQPAQPVQLPAVHVVQPGENLFRISLRYGVTLQSIMVANGIVNVNYVQAGQRLTIPAPATGGPVVNAPTTPVVVQPVIVQPVIVQSTVRTHIVRQGDTLSQVAVWYGVTVESIRAANNITNNRLIFPGQVLTIPYGATGGPIVRQTVTGYIVQPGDTLFAIAARLGVDVYTLARANGLLNLNVIYVGQFLRLP